MGKSACAPGAALAASSGSFPKEPFLSPKQGRSPTSVPAMGTPQHPEGSLGTSLSHVTSASPCSRVPAGTTEIMLWEQGTAAMAKARSYREP